MNKRLLAWIVVAGGLLLTARTAFSWWDTVITAERPVPLVREIKAETCAGPAGGDIVQDEQADGGKGGRAVLLRPGGPGLTTDIEVDPGVYAIFTIARDPAGKPDEHGILQRKVGHGLMTLEVKEHQSGQTRSWTMIVVHREQFFAVGQMYFPAYAGGKYTVTVKLATEMPRLPEDPPAVKRFLDPNTRGLMKPPIPLLVDRLELRDALGNCARQAAKTRRMLTSDEELATLRKDFAEKGGKPLEVYREPYTLTNGRPLDPGARKARNDKLWGLVPDFNAHVSSDYESPYSYVIGRDRNGLVANVGTGYERTGNAEFGWDGAILLCALADKWPAVDFLAQGTEGGAGVNLQYGFIMNPLVGKQLYRGWSDTGMVRLARTYDQLFDFIKGNQELAAYVGGKIPWVRTPEDVIRLLDVNLLQSGMDYCRRNYIQHDEPKALIPLVQGVNPISDRMLASGIFHRTGLNMALRGGIDDQTFTTLSRDGIHYMGAVSYYSPEFERLGEYLHKYRLAGGSPRFDLHDGDRCPQMVEAARSTAQAHAAGGYMLNFGDGPTMLTGRRAGFEKDWPSRILAGAGISVLESGQFQRDPLRKRAVGLYFGLGRGHAHQDTLTIEVLAHGCRMAPDTGGRHEAAKGSPNMRWNKVHNLVEVDLKNFENIYPGTVSATGWNTCFAPLPGAQYMEHRARATSHPYVSLYGRQTAMIDVGDDSYLFDVFRVRGGKVHTYCFHGCPTKQLAVNADLAPAAGAEATAYLAEHFKGTQREGVAPAMLQADWAMDPARQKTWQGELYRADTVPATRFALFGHEGEKVMVGNAWSNNFTFNYPYLYVQGRQDAADRESVFPAIIEPFAGKPFLVEKRQVSVAPAQRGAASAVGVEVKTASGRADLLYAAGDPMASATLDGAVKVAGKFALLSRDEKGVVRGELVGGTDLATEDLTIKAERAAYQGRITGVSYDDREFTVDVPLPGRLLRGQVAQIGPDAPPEIAGRTMHHAFTLSDLAPEGRGTRVRHEKTAKYYQSTIVNVDEKAGAVEAEIEPVVFGCDPEFATGTTVTNERQDKFWKATLEEGDRWMHIGHPGYRGSYPDKCSLADFPDADGDGRRVAKLIGVSDGATEDKDAQGNSLHGKVLLELEVTRLTPDGETFYFKLPRDERYQRGGWQYAYRLLVNEDGSRRWTAKFPGSSFVWRLQGGLEAADFADADGDGKTKISACLFGPGDRMTLDTAVSVVRGDAPGLYEVRSNVACTLGLPRGDFSRTEISPDGKTFAPIACRADGARIVVTLSAADLGEGSVTLRLSK